MEKRGAAVVRVEVDRDAVGVVAARGARRSIVWHGQAAMLSSVQTFEAPALAAFRRFHGAFHPRLWVHVVEQTGRVDEGLVPNLGSGRPVGGRRLVGFTLAGHNAVRSQGGALQWGRAGCALSCDGRSNFLSRAEALDAEPSLSVNVDWDAGFFGSRAVRGLDAWRLSASGFQRVRRAVESLRRRIDDAWNDPRLSPAVAAGVGDLLLLLRAEGADVPTPAAGDLAIPWDAAIERTSRALDRALSGATELPMLVDVEASTGVSTRTVQRVLPAVLRAWGQRPDGFRTMRKRLHLFRACWLMSHPRASTEGTAALLGFSTPNALCRLFANAGLPSPGRVPAALVRAA